MTTPAITVLIPAYNAANWIRDALESILRQSYSDFEVLVLDDGSDDQTPRIVGAYADTRIRTIRQDENQGLVATLNHGLELARGKFIARMDADDVAHPRRLERQISFLESHPEVGICGTWFWLRYDHKRVAHRTPCRHEEILAHLFFRSSFAHPTVMLRRELLVTHGLRYDAAAKHAEDYDLWVRARQLTRYANIPEYLLEYRVHEQQVGAKHVGLQNASAARIRLSQLSALVPEATKEMQDLHLRVCEGGPFDKASELGDVRHWLDLLRRYNDERRVYAKDAFADALAATWAECCIKSTVLPGRSVPVYLSRHYAPLSRNRLREHGLMVRASLRRLLA